MIRKSQTSIALAFVSVLASTLCLQAQQPQSKDFPKTEVFLGYSYLRAVPTLADGNRLVTLNGGNASVAYNLNRYLGLVTDFAGFADSEIRLSGPGANPARIEDSTGTAYTFLFGPRLSFRQHQRFTPFVQVLAGGAYATAVPLDSCHAAPCTPLPEQGSFAMTAGGGLDLKVSRHLALRLVQAEYLMTRFADVTTTTRQNQNDLRLSAGLVFRFGGHRMEFIPNRAPVSVCSADKQVVYVGSMETVGVHARAVDADNDALIYAWTASSGTVTGSGPDAQWNYADAPAGAYTVKVHVEDGKGGTSDCAVDIQVAPKVNHVPVLTCSVDQASVEAGEIVHLTANGSDADNDALTYTWETTGGQLAGSGAAGTLQTPTGAGSSYTVMGHVNDGHGGSADCSLTVTTHPSAAMIKLEERLELHSIYFPTAEPTEKEPNRGLVPSQHKTLLSLAADFSEYLKARPDAHLILEGHADPRGSVEYNQKLSGLRVEITKRFLVEHGVPEQSIDQKAFGDQHNLSKAQVTDAIEHTPELGPEDRARALRNMTTILLASNRRVDVTLSTTSQHSLRQYPFNAADSMTLLSRQKPTRSARGSKKR
ncbi:OmpA family protein [Terriglobus saanensis]|uniref:OmpA/MotB domain protein n=1 Tax=Terriglobus saanensis (strain ATCC BAA-1853 / DSM 23119 / SP1PR4) TaxID=401053 RepID=E8UYG1_TERSS|nr:OmpA family protein [Terriglobus saanensis]ADV82049.1 OmpA/MotB domain protein [Terriglobus saanensis SP1PR4]